MHDSKYTLTTLKSEDADVFMHRPLLAKEGCPAEEVGERHHAHDNVLLCLIFKLCLTVDSTSLFSDISTSISTEIALLNLCDTSSYRSEKSLTATCGHF